MQPTVTILLSIVLILVGTSDHAHAQVLSSRRTTSDDRALAKPSLDATRKEELLIREVLEPELLLRVDTVKSKIIRTNIPLSRHQVRDPSVLEVDQFPGDGREIEIIGLRNGETTLTLWFIENEEVHVLRYLVQVHTSNGPFKNNVEDLQTQINEMFPNSQVQLIPLRDKLIVRGQVRDSDEADKILALLGAGVGGGRGGFRGGAGGFGGGRGGFVGGGLSGGLGGGFGGAGNAGGNNLGSNQMGGNQTGGNRNDFGAQNGGLGTSGFQIVNLLRIPGVQQVMLKVRVAELSRFSSRDLGADLRGVFSSLSLSTLSSGLDDFSAILDGDDLRFFIRAVTSNGYGKILAEPTLVTISGKPARFLAGGEFAVPTTVGVQGVGAATTTFRGFGTELEFTPTVMDKDLVRLQVSPSFSSLNADAAVNGIPGLDRRVVDTTVDLREGQWLAIAGLIQDQQGGNRAKLPYLGRLPLVGGFFGRQDTSRQETELIVLVSPQLVHPMEPEEVPLQLPGMEVTDPRDDDFFLRHMIEGFNGAHHRSTTHTEIEAQYLGQERATGGGFGRGFIGRGGLIGAGGLLGGCRGGSQCEGGCRCDEAVEVQNEYLLGPSGFSE